MHMCVARTILVLNFGIRHGAATLFHFEVMQDCVKNKKSC